MLSDIIDDGKEWPRISIVTPSYNQASFLEETIRSVLLQGYPDMEYIVMDGGSSDGSVDIIRKYAPYLARWVSEPDRGQADAINKGFYLSSGDILGWQNSDDVYTEGSVCKAVQCFDRHPHVDLVFGDVLFVNATGDVIQDIRFRPFHSGEYLYLCANITNQSAFWRRHLFLNVGGLRTEYQYAMDFDFFLRASQQFQFLHVKGLLGHLRIHSGSKTGIGNAELWDAEYMAVRRQWGVTTNDTVPWSQQHRLMKLYFKLRRVFYYLAEGNIDYLWKKFRCHPSVQSWDREKIAKM